MSIFKGQGNGDKAPCARALLQGDSNWGPHSWESVVLSTEPRHAKHTLTFPSLLPQSTGNCSLFADLCLIDSYSHISDNLKCTHSVFALTWKFITSRSEVNMAITIINIILWPCETAPFLFNSALLGLLTHFIFDWQVQSHFWYIDVNAQSFVHSLQRPVTLIMFQRSKLH